MDNSFLRLCDNFDDAKDLCNNKLSEFNYDVQIHLKPGEAYSFISNFKNGIILGGLYKVYLVDSCNNILLDITSNTIIEEFINSLNRSQIKLELVNTSNIDFYTDLVYLRIDHDIVNGKSYWTNPFLFSEYDIDETSRFKFMNYANLDGTEYTLANIFQSIRLKCFKQKSTFTSSSQSYTTFQGLKYSSRVIKTKAYDFIFDLCNDFIYERLQYLLTHDVIYADGVRVTDKQTFENPDKLGNSNVSQLKFKLSVNEYDIDKELYQMYIPENNYVLANSKRILSSSNSNNLIYK